MTRLLLDPAADLPDSPSAAPVTVTATLLDPDPTEVLTFAIASAADVVDIPVPAAFAAWRLTVRRSRPTVNRFGIPGTEPGPIVEERTTRWGGLPSIAWADLVDLDPTSLQPTSSSVTAWQAVLADVQDAADRAATASTAATAARDGMVVSAHLEGDELVLVGLDGGEVFRGTVVGPRGLQGLQGLQGVKGDRGDAGPAGDRGPAGLQGTQGIAGPVGPAGLTWRGVWSATIDYVINDAVYYGGASYFAMGDPVPGEVPDDTSTGHWMPLALRGAQGIQGAQGVKGDTGAAATLPTDIVTAQVDAQGAVTLYLNGTVL